MRKVLLKDIVLELESGSRPKGGVKSETEGAISIGGEHLSKDGGFKLRKVKYVPFDFYKKLKKGKVREGDILIVKDGATTGKVSFVEWDSFKTKNVCINEHVFLLRLDKEQILPKYLFYFLFSPVGQIEVLKDFRGAAIGGITRGFLKRVSFILPDLSTQRKIVAVLDKAQSLITKRKESLKQLDELLRATFLEMFGDPVLNPKGWVNLLLEKSIDKIESGWSPVCEDNSRDSNEEWAVLKQSAVSRRYFEASENKKLPENIEIKKEVTANQGDLLFSRKNSAQFVGAVTYVFNEHQRLLLPDTIFKLVFKEGFYSNVYLFYLFNDDNFRRVVGELKSGAASSMPNISKGKLLTLKIPTPHIDEQKRFEKIVLKAYDRKQQLNHSLSIIESLFQSILQRAFKGTLKFAENEEVLDLELDQKVKGFTKDGEIDWKELGQSLLKHFSPVNNESENDLDKPAIDWEKYKDKSGTDLLMEMGQSLLDFYKDSNKSIELTNEQPIIDWDKFKDKPLTDVFLEVSKAYLNLGKGDEDSKLPFPFNLSENEKNLLIKKFNTYKDGELTSFQDKQEYNDYKGTLFTLIKTGLIKQVFNEETKEMKLELA